MKISAFGDSVMKGIIMDNRAVEGKKNNYVISEKRFSTECENILGIHIDNYAKFGSTTTQGLNSIKRYYDKIKDSDLVVLEFGGNDCDFAWNEVSLSPQKEHKPRNTIEEFRSFYSNIIDTIKKIGKQVLLLSLPPIDSEKYLTYISQGLSRENILQWLGGNCLYLERWHERYNLEVFKIGVENRTTVIDITSPFLERGNYADYLCADGIHPNELGHKLIAQSVSNFLQKNNMIS